MSKRYVTMFARLQDAGEGAFVPFVTLGDPDPDTSVSVVQCLIDAGADALELGIPFSDPLADGPIIQDANLRALTCGVNTWRCFEMISRLRSKNPDIPIGLLVYANLVYVHGIERFYRHAAHAGVDSILVADVPLQEMTDYLVAANRTGIAPVLVLPPGVDQETLVQVAAVSQGYLYVMSRAGVTGVDQVAHMPVDSLVDALHLQRSAPPLLGFGISTPAHVASAMASGVKGVICGSAIVSRIASAQSAEQLHGDLTGFVREMKAATRGLRAPAA